MPAQTEDPAKVLVAFHEDILGGASRAILRAVPRLEERGFRFSFWASRPSPLFDELSVSGYEVAGAPRLIAYSRVALSQPPGVGPRLRRVPGYLRSFRRWLAASGADLVHANSVYTLAEAVAARTAGVPVVLYAHEMVRPGWKGTALRLAADRVATELVAVSRACADGLAWGRRSPRVVFGAAPAISPAPAARRAGPLRVGTVGVISRRKGTDVLIEAARLVAGRGGGVEFIVVGAPTDVLDAAWAEAQAARARELGMAHHERADVAAALADWDLFVIPSRYDPFPTATLEAMAAGLPVIGAAVDGIAEQVTGATGILVPPDDPDALAAAILELRDAPERRRSMGEAGRRRALEVFTPDRQADGIARAYRAAVAGRR